jgi:hypothetical protein
MPAPAEREIPPALGETRPALRENLLAEPENLPALGDPAPAEREIPLAERENRPAFGPLFVQPTRARGTVLPLVVPLICWSL